MKRSKTQLQKTKIDSPRTVSADVLAFVQQLQTHHYFDLVGYDVARTQDGLHLIELNRSPQIAAYVNHTGINPFEILLQAVYY